LFWCVFIQFCDVAKLNNPPQEYLAKFGYKGDREKKQKTKLRFLLFIVVGYLLETNIEIRQIFYF